jgi:hypothetical protein
MKIVAIGNKKNVSSDSEYPSKPFAFTRRNHFDQEKIDQ